ncbi:hypothetical protein D1007_34051 [Hordeum vulgare]|nr:hypothetical protein D1007_34051 [Hordeum vulgare]
MADAHRVRVEHRTTCIAQTLPVGAACARHSPSPMVNAPTGPEVQEQQGSSQPVIEQVDGRTATPSLARPSGSASRARPDVPHGHARLPWPPRFFVTGLLLTATRTGSSASRS